MMDVSELKVKQFPFPSYEDWSRKHKFQWVFDIGEFRVKVAAVAWGCNGNTENTYKIAISVYENPTNIYTPTIFQESLNCKYDDDVTRKSWYEWVTSQANEFFRQHILSYLQGVEEDG